MPWDVQTYTWAQFVAGVNGLLPVDATRLGPVQPYIALLIRQSVIELETLIPWYRKGHETLYQASDGVGEGWATRFTLPPQARVKDAHLVVYDCAPKPNPIPPPVVVLAAGQLTFHLNGTADFDGLTIGLVYSWTQNGDTSLTCGSTTLTASGTFTATSTDAGLTGTSSSPNTSVITLFSIPTVLPTPVKQNHCERFPLKDFAWEHRFSLVNGGAALNDGKGAICFDPEAETFYVYPAVRDCQNVSVFWDGLKINFQPYEITPFDEQMTLVVSLWVKAMISREVDKDLPLSEDYMNSYKQQRRMLYITMKDRSQTNTRTTT